MCYVLRDRTDGQVEIMLMTSALVGVFVERAVAERVVAFLRDNEPAAADDEPALFGHNLAARVAAENTDLAELADEIEPRKTALVPAASVSAPHDAPRAPAFKTADARVHGLSDEQIDAAFARVQDGEKIHLVAPDYGLTMFQLRGMWAAHKRKMQAFMASAGAQPCRLCGREFVPSISCPDTCARCSK